MLTWFNFNFLLSSLNIEPELYLNIHSGNLKNVLGQKDKQSCMHAFLQAVTAVKFPRKYSRQRDVTIITSTHVIINYNQKTRGKVEGKVDNRPSNDPQVLKSELYQVLYYILRETIYYLHFERSDNFLWKSMKLKWA